jgi:hypothetical protein
MKVKIDCWWTDSQSITGRVIKQFVTNEEQLKGIEFVYDNSYDYLIIFGRPNSNTQIKDKSKTFCFTMEPLWSPNNTISLDEISDYILVHDKRGYKNLDCYKENLVYMLYGGRGEINFSQREYDWTYENLYNKKYNKTKSISFIVRNAYESHYNYSSEIFKIIYVDRVKIGERIIENKLPIDIYGNYWEKKDNVFGEVWNKMIALDGYKFSIACENTIQKNYISEKFWDCVLCETIPINFGCNNINDYLPQLAEFDFTDIINDYSEIEYRLKHIIKNQDDIYIKYVDTIRELKNEYFLSEKFNLFLKIKSLINEN